MKSNMNYVVQEDEHNLDQDCAVCLQKCHHPTQLPCGHIFCFLCVKGVAIQNKRCAMCRAEIPSDYLDHPILLEKLSPADQIQVEYQWYYEGRNGWWKYDERSNAELESAFSDGGTKCSLLLAGALYIIDFQSMTQVRRSDQTRRRRVRRDTPLFPAKGIAGIKTDKVNREQVNSEDENNANNIMVQTDADETIEISDDEIIVSQELPQLIVVVDDDDDDDDGVNNAVERLGILSLQQPDSPGGDT